MKKLIEQFAGNFADDPSGVELSKEASILLSTAYGGFSKGDPMDCHVHLIGKGTGNTGCYANPEFFTWKHPVERLRMLAFLDSSGVKDVEKADQEYVARLLKLTDDSPLKGKIVLLPLDKVYHEDGTADDRLTKFYVPNEYLYTIAKERPDRFIPAISIHPYRKDALKELEKWAERGVKTLKWLPNSMGMDPSHPKCIPFYKKMQEYGMVLLGHAGKENAINVIKFNQLGNPLLYRAALDAGLKVLMAHCAGMGMGKDLDAAVPVPIKNHKLFIRLMGEKQYEGLLFGDLAAITTINRMGAPLAGILKHKEFHHRIINGSDYPLPAANALVSTKALEKLGYITGKERGLLNEIYYKNPLTFDFVLKRTVRHPKLKHRFPPEIFKDHPELKLTETL